MTDRPEYRVPTLDEIRALPWNGYTVSSLFAGGGGSSTGYRMAGYNVVFANDIVAEARNTYSANCADYTVVDGTDVRELKGSTILDAAEAHTGKRHIDIFDGSPPCQAFSTAGPRDKGWGKIMDHADGTNQRSDDLFFEYARLLDEVRPSVFVAENVSGLVKGVARGYFKRILAALQACGYQVEARLLDAQWLGVPQARQRLVFIGVRSDLAQSAGVGPAFPSPLPYNYPLAYVCSRVAQLKLESSRRQPSVTIDDATKRPSRTLDTQGIGGYIHYEIIEKACPDVLRVEAPGYGHYHVLDDARKMPARTLAASGYSSVGEYDLVCADGSRRKFTLDEIKAIGSFPPDYIFTGGYRQAWTRIGNSVPPLMMKAVASTIQSEILDRIGRD